MAFSVKQVQATPNPNAVKFVLDRAISGERLSFPNPPAARNHPLAARLFAIEGVTSLLMLDDFLTVNKTPAARWAGITPKVKKTLATEGN